MTSSEHNAGERLPCAHCGEKIGVYVPKGGDGSLVVVRRHNVRKAQRCPGSNREPSTYRNETHQ